MSEDLDLSNIDPLKWAEVRRRAAAVRAYIALEKQTAADRERFAAMLDLGPLQFSNLVKAWVAHRDAIALAPGMRRANISRSIRDGVDPRAREIARGVIADMGSAAPLPDLAAKTIRLCDEAEVTPPSLSTIWLLAAEARGLDGRGEPAGIVIAHAHVRLPVDTGRGVVFPEVIIAAETPSGRIIDIVLIRAGGDFDARRIVEGIQRQPSFGTLPIVAGDADAKAVARYLPMGIVVTPVTPADATRTLSMAVGKRLGLLVLTYRPPTARPATVMRSGLDRAPCLDDAELMLLIARDRHNAELMVSA